MPAIARRQPNPVRHALLVQEPCTSAQPPHPLRASRGGMLRCASARYGAALRSRPEQHREEGGDDHRRRTPRKTGWRGQRAGVASPPSSLDQLPRQHLQDVTLFFFTGNHLPVPLRSPQSRPSLFPQGPQAPSIPGQGQGVPFLDARAKKIYSFFQPDPKSIFSPANMKITTPISPEEKGANFAPVRRSDPVPNGCEICDVSRRRGRERHALI